METNTDEDPCDKLKGLNAERKKLQALLNVDEGESIPDKVKALAEEMRRIGAHIPDTNRPVSETIGEMAKSLAKLREMLTRLEDITSESGPDDVSSHVEKLANEKEVLDDMLNDIEGPSIPAKVKALIGALSPAASALECKPLEVPEKAKVMKNQHGQLDDLLEKSKGAIDPKEGEELEDL